MKISFHILSSALIWREKGLLLLHRQRPFKEINAGKGLWELPGGKLAFGESPVQSLRREIREETGWHVRHKMRWRKTLVYRLRTTGTISYRLQLIYEIHAENANFDPPQLGDEHNDFQTIKTAAALKKLSMLPVVRTYLLRILTLV